MHVRAAGPLLLALGLVVPAGAQEAGTTADPTDVTTLDGIVTALYQVISGPAGDRDWDRFDSLFLPGAILLNAGPRPDTVPAPEPVSPEGYRERAAPYFQENPFYETEAIRTTHRYGTVAQMWSTYESRTDPEAAPFARGINSSGEIVGESEPRSLFGGGMIAFLYDDLSGMRTLGKGMPE